MGENRCPLGAGLCPGLDGRGGHPHMVSLLVLHFQQRLHASDLVYGGVDLLLGVLFLLAFFRTSV